MKKIESLGHEISHHYEDIDLVDWKNKKISYEDLIDLAYIFFYNNLKYLRENFNNSRICMHGNLKSRYNNKIIWKKYNYYEFGILDEPYYDLDYSEFAYFTYTGRRWNGAKDEVDSKIC